MKITPRQFSDSTGLSVELAKKILDLLDKKKLDPQDLNNVIWRLRDIVIKRDLGTLIEKLPMKEIEATIDQMILERSMYDCPKQVCYAQNFEQLTQAFASIGKPQSVWFFADIEKKDGTYKKGDVVTQQIFRVGKWEHPEYGTVEVTEDTITDVVRNFKENVRKIELCVDENHEPDHKALGWYREVFASDDGKQCFAKIELTKKGAELINDGAYKYFSPEICFSKVDEESGDFVSNLLIGGAFTNRPFFKGMQPLMATEGAAAGGKTGASASQNGQVPYFFSNTSTMHKMLLVMDKILTAGTFTEAEKSELEQAYGEITEKARTTELNTKVSELLAKFEEGGAAPAAAPAKPAEGEKPKEGEEVVTPAEGEEGAIPTDIEGEVKANEAEGTFTVDATFMENVRGMQKTLSKVSADATLKACESKAKELCFSEAKKANVILPKHVPKISKFAAGLSDAARKEFFEIIGAFKSIPAGEKGHGTEAAAMDFNDPTSIPLSDEKVQYFMEKMNQKPEMAQKSAATYYRAKAAAKQA